MGKGLFDTNYSGKGTVTDVETRNPNISKIPKIFTLTQNQQILYVIIGFDWKNLFY